MRQFVVASLVTLLFASPVLAQSGSSYDSRGDSLYDRSRNTDSSATVRGSNFGTGTQWNQTVTPGGDQRTSDRKNRWNYGNSSGNYWNTDGKSCWGTGIYRQCN
jgi:hypothetical protein